jgi:hypothetical protein
MKYYGLWVIIIILLSAACKDNKQQTDTGKKQEKTNFFPVADYIRSEISNVDSLPLRIVKYDIRDGHTDSTFIQAAEFNQLAKEFLPEALDAPAFGAAFTENAFLDQTTQSLTFTYSLKNNKPGLQRVDVLATPDPGFDKVKSIYMEELIEKKDTSIIKKMYWRARKSFQVITIIQPANQTAINKQLKVVWDNFE